MTDRKTKTYKLIDHTADFGIRVFGSDSRNLFTNAAHALFDVLTDINSLKGRNKTQITIQGDDRPDLMVNWLRELLYLWTVEEFLVKKADIHTISKHQLTATIIYDVYEPAHHIINIEIKAVTYHQVEVVRRPDGWESTIIFDV